MVRVYATHVWFDMTDDRGIFPGSPRYGLMSDAEADEWPRGTFLVGPWEAGRRPAELDDVSRKFFGDRYALAQGRAPAPPHALARWETMGTVRRILYLRRGHGGPPGRRERVHLFRRPPALFAWGAWLRLELGPNARVLEDHIFIDP